MPASVGYQIPTVPAGVQHGGFGARRLPSEALPTVDDVLFCARLSSGLPTPMAEPNLLWWRDVEADTDQRWSPDSSGIVS